MLKKNTLSQKKTLYHRFCSKFGQILGQFGTKNVISTFRVKKTPKGRPYKGGNNI